MKKFITIFVMLALWFVTMWAVPQIRLDSSYADNGVSVGNRSYTLVSTIATTAGGEVSGTATFDNPMNQIACDIVSTNLTATGIFNLEGNAGSSTTSFMASNLTTTVKTAGAIGTVFVTGKPVRILRARYILSSMASQTNGVTVNCLGVQ